MKKIVITLTAILFITISTMTAQTTWYVDSASKAGNPTGKSWANAFPLLQTALDSAIAGDQIWVAKGTYKPTKKAADTSNMGVVTTDRDMTFVLQSGVAIYGGFAGTETILSERVLPPFRTASRTILSGDIGSTYNFDNCYHVIVSSGDSTEAGSLDGITITQACSIDGNFDYVTINEQLVQRSNGGGIYNVYSSPTLTNITINKNIAIYNGGGIYNENSSPTLTHVSINGNEANVNGGGMFNNNSSPILTNVTINENEVGYKGGGGGVYNLFSSPTFTNVTISGNLANSPGGGMFNNNSSPTLTNVLINGNFSNSSGGGMYNVESSPMLINVTISGNKTPEGGGGGMYNVLFASPILRNTIVWGNISGVHNAGLFEEPIYYYSLVQERDSTDNGCIAAGTVIGEVFEAQTNYKIAPTVTGNYYLNAGSPCINTGNNDYNIQPADLNGNPRIYNTIIDMGAYEYDPNIIIGIRNIATSNIIIYPNPAQHTLFIESAEKVEQVNIYDISGRMLKNTTHAVMSSAVETSLTIDVSNLANGIYLVKVKTSQGEAVKRVVISD